MIGPVADLKNAFIGICKFNDDDGHGYGVSVFGRQPGKDSAHYAVVKLPAGKCYRPKVGLMTGSVALGGNVNGGAEKVPMATHYHISAD